MQALVCIKQRTLLDHVLLPRTKIVEQDLFFVFIFGIRCSLFDDNGYPSRNAITFTIIIILQLINFVQIEVTTNYNHTQTDRQLSL